MTSGIPELTLWEHQFEPLRPRRFEKEKETTGRPATKQVNRSHPSKNKMPLKPSNSFSRRQAAKARRQATRKPRACRVCHCTDYDCRGCIERTGRPCHWVGPTLCSACADLNASIDRVRAMAAGAEPETDAAALQQAQAFAGGSSQTTKRLQCVLMGCSRTLLRERSSVVGRVSQHGPDTEMRGGK